MTLRKNHSAFTLLEIMLVVTIIGLLLGAAIVGFRGNVEYSRRVRVQGDIQGISTQLKLYESMNGFCPTTEQGLKALVMQPDTSGHDIYDRRRDRSRYPAATPSTPESRPLTAQSSPKRKLSARQPQGECDPCGRRGAHRC